jgi:hypothetical protein
MRQYLWYNEPIIIIIFLVVLKNGRCSEGSFVLLEKKKVTGRYTNDFWWIVNTDGLICDSLHLSKHFQRGADVI